MSLNESQVRSFIEDGFVRLDEAFPRALADAGRAILWRDAGCDPHDRSTWTRPVVRLGDYAQAPFAEAVNTPALHAAFDTLVGRGRWLPRASLGTFPIRFPSLEDPGDAGWHVDASFADETSDPADYFSWRVNFVSRGRALLMLFLFSDVGPDDAPTRIRVGSHHDVARQLAAAGDAGLRFVEVDTSVERPEVLATGAAGTVYLCHPFLVHAAQPHRGTTPRFMAQPPLLPAEPFQLERANADYSPVEAAIRLALGRPTSIQP
jgi:Phytanoyl-CoA dioxygenase (PhyH)